MLCQGAGCVVVWVVANPLSDMGGLWSRRDARFRDAGAKRTCPVWLHDEFGNLYLFPNGARLDDTIEGGQSWLRFFPTRGDEHWESDGDCRPII